MDAENRKPEKSEAWLDEALHARADAEPRSGLEERVLARLAAEPRRRPFAWWPMLAAASAILIAVITLALFRAERHAQQIANRPSAVTPAVKTQVPPVVATIKSAIAQHPQTSHRKNVRHGAPRFTEVAAAGTRGGNRAPLPKLVTFPAPRPETAQERMLAKLAAQGGPVEVAQVQERPVSEFVIQPMEEPPSDHTPQE